MTSQKNISKDRSWAWHAGALGVALCMTLAPLAAVAEKADQEKPTNIAADHTESDDLHQIDIFTGNVILTKGTILLRSDKLLVHQDPEGYQSGVATWDGKTPVYFKQKREGFADQYMEGWAERIEYDERTSLVKLFNHAIVKRLEGAKDTDEAVGDTITYNSDTEKYWVESGGTEVRTHTVIQPKTAPCPAGTSGTPTPLPAGAAAAVSAIPAGCTATTAPQKPAAAPTPAAVSSDSAAPAQENSATGGAAPPARTGASASADGRAETVRHIIDTTPMSADLKPREGERQVAAEQSTLVASKLRKSYGHAHGGQGCLDRCAER